MILYNFTVCIVHLNLVHFSKKIIEVKIENKIITHFIVLLAARMKLVTRHTTSLTQIESVQRSVSTLHSLNIHNN